MPAKKSEDDIQPTYQKIEKNNDIGDLDIIFVEKEIDEELGQEDERPIKGKTQPDTKAFTNDEIGLH